MYRNHKNIFVSLSKTQHPFTPYLHFTSRPGRKVMLHTYTYASQFLYFQSKINILNNINYFNKSFVWISSYFLTQQLEVAVFYSCYSCPEYDQDNENELEYLKLLFWSKIRITLSAQPSGAVALKERVHENIVSFSLPSMHHTLQCFHQH